MSDVIYVEKVWGSERWIVNTDSYCGKVMTLSRKHRCSIHKHLIKDETFYVTKGFVVLEVGDDPEALEKHTLEPGDSFRIQPGVWHRFSGLTDAEIIEISTHHEDSDSVRHCQSERIPDDEWPRV